MKRSWFWGVFFICAAAFVIMSAMGLLVDVSVWKIVLAVLLAALIIQSLIYVDFFGIFMPLAILCILFDAQLGIQIMTSWSILAAALFLSIGMSILFRKRIHRHHKGGWCHHGHHSETTSANGAHTVGDHDTKETITDDIITSSVSFGASTKYLHAEKLRRAKFDCSFGALKVFFDQATLHPDGAEVVIDCSFGGVELYIPRKWRVVDRIQPSMGAVKNQQNAGSGDETITLSGSVSFGSVEVIYI